VVKEFAAASTIAEEIISSVKTAQAFGAQTTLGELYDQSLKRAQRVGYKQQLAGAIMLSVMFFSIYGFYGLGFCMFP
jgi:ATP-binding cassette, subfamily B (MDR/TAP), member 1